MKINCGDNIRRYRQLSKLSQTDLGKMLDVSHAAISSWELNRTEPNMGQIEKMSQIFGCKKSQLMGLNRSAPTYAEGTAEIIDLYSRATEEQRMAVLNLLRSFVQE